VLKFMGDGVLAIFPVTGAPAEACGAALAAVAAARAGMPHPHAGRQPQGPPFGAAAAARAGGAHLEAPRQAQGLPPLPFGAALHLGEILWGNIGAADRLAFTALGPAVNLGSRLAGP